MRTIESFEDYVDPTQEQYESSCALKLARKCGIEHWFPCGADGRAAGGRCTVT